MSWAVRLEPTREGPGQRALAVELDPRVPQATLVWRTLGLGAPEVGSRAMFRQFLEGVDGDLEPAERWLRGPQATALLDRISAGYSGSMTWSGDFVGRWTPDAWGAAEQVVAGLQTALRPG